MKKPEERPNRRRLELRRQVVRVLTPTKLERVKGGYGVTSRVLCCGCCGVTLSRSDEEAM
jgi:hypothetical protein